MSIPAHGSKSDSSGLLGGPVRLGDVDEVDPDAGTTVDRPRIESTRMSGASRNGTTSGWRAFQRSRPSRASGLVLRPGDLDDRDGALAAAGRRGPGAGPLGRQARVRVAGGHRGRALGGDIRRRAAAFAATRLVLGLRAGAPGMAGPAAAHRPAWRSSVATGRRPGPRPRRGPRARGAPRATRPPRRSRPRVADRREPGRDRVDRERLRLDRRDLVPGQRRRDPGIGERPDRIGRRHRPVLGVLVVVEEDAVALLLPPLGGREAPGRAAPRPGRARGPRAEPPGTSSAARSGR